MGFDKASAASIELYELNLEDVVEFVSNPENRGLSFVALSGLARAPTRFKGALRAFGASKSKPLKCCKISKWRCSIPLTKISARLAQ